MASQPFLKRKNIVPSRRRRRRNSDDEEDDVSALGDAEDDSPSETSAISNADEDADAEASDISADEESLSPEHTQTRDAEDSTSAPMGVADTKVATANMTFKTSADTEVMLNGIKTTQAHAQAEELHFDELGDKSTVVAGALIQRQQQGSVRQQSFLERNRREHQEYLKQRDTNPAFVPNRGGFFLHDNRTLPTGPSNLRFPDRGRGKGLIIGTQAGRGAPIYGPAEGPWAHDLHEVVSRPDQHVSLPTVRYQAPKQNKMATITTAPNRSFSTSVVVGHLPIHVHFPGMSKRVTIPNIVRRQHTLLPQHRPPLRRDKPVRVFLPDIAPRYIFPSNERSFIFIPRAMRPNQNYQRGRGRGSLHGSRRTSIFGGSGYAASIAMSRRSSVGQPISRDGLRSPATSVRSGNAVPEQRMGRPVVRVPAVTQQMSNVAPIMMQPINSVTRESSQQALPMHQPRPQKNVSLADIESPASFTFNSIPQQEEQPFHHQVPMQMGAQTYGEGPKSRRPSFLHAQGQTPLGQIPDRAIYAAPFQPYPIYQAPSFYPPGPIFYPPINPDGTIFTGGVPQQVLPTPFGTASVPASSAQPAPHPQPNITQANMMAHESNGMVFYYDPASLPEGPLPAPVPQFQMPPAGNMMGMITPAAQYYYPPMNGVYYAQQ